MTMNLHIDMVKILYKSMQRNIMQKISEKVVERAGEIRILLVINELNSLLMFNSGEKEGIKRPLS